MNTTRRAPHSAPPELPPCDNGDAQALYDDTASRWIRTEPVALSDFTARPMVLDLCEPVVGLRVLDLGCGEGYCARRLQRRGAASIVGVDLSAEMIAAAKLQESRDPQGIVYETGDAVDLSRFEDASFDLVVAVFLFSYLDRDGMARCLSHVRRVLCPGGRLVFAVPHPAFPFMRAAAEPFYFQIDGGYYSARDRRCGGRIWRRDGTALEVQVVHKTIEDHFTALQEAGFDRMPRLRELRVTPEILDVDPAFFGPLLDTPLHLAIAIDR